MSKLIRKNNKHS